MEPLKLNFSIIIAIFENTYRRIKYINLSTSSLGIFGQASESFFTLLLKSNAPHCNLLQGSEEQMVARGFWNHVFSVKGRHSFDIKRPLQKGAFVLLLKRAWVQTPRTP